MLVVTTDAISGWQIQRVCGEVFGVVSRLFEDEAMLVDNRHEAVARMLDHARTKGGNAVVGLRFDTSSLDGPNELCAYGTAVVAIPMDDGARRTATALGYGAPPTPQPTQQPQYAPGYGGDHPPQGYPT